MDRYTFRIHETNELRTVNIEPKIIKTDAEYRAYVEEVERLAAEDPPLGSPDGDRLELLAKLVEDYEVERYKFERPDPIEAIRFRMEEQGLKQKDLAPILGGKNRVSEILNGKRPLTLAMVRALNETLKIPVELLIGDRISHPYRTDTNSEETSTSFNDKADAIREPQPPVDDVPLLHHMKPELGPLFLKRTITYGATPKTNKTNLKLWVMKVRKIAEETRKERGPWNTGTLNAEFLQYIARLSPEEEGPRLAKRILAENGITLIILPALPKTKLDGAAMLGEDGSPVIGMTIRHDRIDNFWFTLLHELAHAWKHLPDPEMAITDEDIDQQEDHDENEAEANRLARDAFIPRSQWKRSEAFLRPSAETIQEFAQKLHIHPAIVAGRLRREKSGYRAFNKLVGHREVRRLFPEVQWP